MRTVSLLIIFLASVLAVSQPVNAQQPVSLPVTNPGITYDFGSFITFQAQINLNSAPVEAYLMFRADGEDTTRVIPIKLDAQGNTLLRYDMSQGAVRPFATVRYLYRIKLADGQELTSQEYFFQYEDNRFTWLVLKGETVTVHWYDGDVSFGQDALDIAERGVREANKLMLVNQTKPLDVYIYSSSSDLARALEVGGLTSVGGHASPDLRLGLVSITPGPDQKLEMDQKIPHELAHILTFDLMGERYSHVPIWLREGIASRVELTPNPDYSHSLLQASSQGTLIPINDLCGAFPPEKNQLLLAYAESESFTRYIIDKFGQTGLLALTGAYGDGLDCMQGMQQALGQSLPNAEAEWHTNVLGEDASMTAFTNLFPYLATLVIVLTVAMVSAFTTRRSHNNV